MLNSTLAPKKTSPPPSPTLLHPLLPAMPRTLPGCPWWGLAQRDSYHWSWEYALQGHVPQEGISPNGGHSVMGTEMHRKGHEVLGLQLHPAPRVLLVLLPPLLHGLKPPWAARGQRKEIAAPSRSDFPLTQLQAGSPAPAPARNGASKSDFMH